MHPDQRPYFKFTARQRLEKSINSLLGIIQGVAIDGKINATEAAFLELWLTEHDLVRDRHPFNELIPAVEAAVEDGQLSEDERADLNWLCERLTSTTFFDKVSADLQRLHAVLGGIVADTRISEDELRGLSDWLADHDHLKTSWPYDEVGSLVTSVLADRTIDDEEHKALFAFFADFTALADGRTIINAPVEVGATISGLCAVCPEITFDAKNFCFTGSSPRYTRKELANVVVTLGGTFQNNVSSKVHFLVIGAEGNDCWAYACYGRKVEEAVALRKAGHRIVIVHENDFHDAVADHR